MSPAAAAPVRARALRPRGARADLLIGLAATAGLVALAVWLRRPGMGAGLWIDEGLSWGISSHALLDIPGVLRQDGSPPLYYMLLHVWMDVFGSGEEALHALSLAFALLTIPAAIWAGWSLFGRSTGLACGFLAALLPYLAFYAREARMYALVALLSVLLCAAFAHAFAYRRRRYLPAVAVLAVLLLYTHVWAFFLMAGAAAALVVCLRATPEPDERRRVLRDALLVAAGILVAYAPWLPTLWFQIRHTGAPWADPPNLQSLWYALESMHGGKAGAVAVLLGAGAGLVRVVEGDRGPRRTAAIAVFALGAAAIATAFLASQASPAWANRYFAILVGPLLVASAVGLARAGRLGIVVLVLLAVWWAEPRSASVFSKSNVRSVAEEVEPLLRPGDLVLSTHPEQVPVLSYYLGAEPAYATSLGRVADPGVMDWRDALERLEATDPERLARRLVDGLEPGARLVLVRPIIQRATWTAPWTELVRIRSAEIGSALARDERLVEVLRHPHFRRPTIPHGVRTVVYRVRRSGP
jgi:mannosyltransferase